MCVCVCVFWCAVDDAVAAFNTLLTELQPVGWDDIKKLYDSEKHKLAWDTDTVSLSHMGSTHTWQNVTVRITRTYRRAWRQCMLARARLRTASYERQQQCLDA